jgi:hypothetical protein
LPRARAALLTQLRGTTPALSESDSTRERLGLEEAIRKVEAEEARRGRRERPPVLSTPLRADPPPPPPSSEQSPDPDVAVRPAAAAPEPRPGRQKPPAARDIAPPPEASQASPVAAEPSRQDTSGKGSSFEEEQRAEADRPAALRSIPPEITIEQQPPAAAADDIEAVRVDAALRKLRDRLTAGEADVVPRWPRTSQRDVRDVQAEKPDLSVEHEPPASVPEPDESDNEWAVRDGGMSYAEAAPRPRWSGGLVKIVIAIVVLAVLGALVAVGYRERGSLIALYHLFRGPPAQVTHDEARTPPKIEDRVGSAQPDRLPGSQQRGTAPSAQSPAVAQRVVLYEEDPADPAGKRFVGSVIWRTETVSPGPGLAPELAVKASIEIPERGITMTFSMVRNTDPKLPASHTIDIRFKLPPGFPGGGVANVPGILMKQAEQTRGVPLAGIAVKVTDNVFLIGLSSVDSDVQRNMQLLKERTWFDIPVVYSNGSRAILAMEKGTPGERAFNDAFTAWGRSGSAAR